MDNKILVEVFVPAAGKSYDVKICPESKIYELIEMLKQVVGDLDQGYYIPNAETVLCDKSAGTVMQLNATVAEHGLYNGSKLILI